MIRAVIVGLGRSGLACARYFAKRGDEVLVVDRADTPALRLAATALGEGVEVRLGDYPEDVAHGADLISPSPGVRWDAPELEWARRNGIAVRSEMELVMGLCPAPIVAITGTNGKTTTTALTGAVLRGLGVPVHVGGNIGETIIDRLDSIGHGDIVVLELSSFQIESMQAPRCAYSCVLNVTPDHLDRHGGMREYTAIKRRLVEHAQEGCVLNADATVTRDMGQHADAPVRYFGFGVGADRLGATVVGDTIVSREDAGDVPILPLKSIRLLGRHNISNVLAATAIGRMLRVSPESIAMAVAGFEAVEHRLQPILDIDGVLWINDSKATNIDSAVTALQAFQRPIVWIGGGSTKGTPPDELADALCTGARVAICNGATGPELDDALEQRGMRSHHRVARLRDAVLLARELAESGDVVLLASGYASYDQFTDFEARGREFVRLVDEVVASAVRRPEAPV